MVRYCCLETCLGSREGFRKVNWNVVLGIVLLGEPFTATVGVGGAAILASVVLASPVVERGLRSRLRDGRQPADS